MRWRTWTLLALGLAGCDSSDAAGVGSPTPEPRGVVVGIDADSGLLPQIAELAVRVTDDASSDIFDTRLPPSLPAELTLVEVEADLRIHIDVDALDASGALLLTRRLTTRFPGEGAVLARMRLNDECLPGVTGRDVSCANATCVAGVCRNPFVASGDLEVYQSDWASAPASLCPSEEGDASASIGDDDAVFSPMQEGALLVPEVGTQGGTHVWLAVLAHNLSLDGMVTFITLDEGPGDASAAQRHAGDYALDDDGCRLDRVRYILPDEASWNTNRRLHVHVSDYTGNAAHAAVDVAIGEPR
jgi:hypothetical protein